MILLVTSSNMKIEKIGEGWYQAQFYFKTKYNTIAVATGYGNTHASALRFCLIDYLSINLL